MVFVAMSGIVVRFEKMKKPNVSDILYFPEPGVGNTGFLLERARKRCEEMGLTYVVVATNTGLTVRRLLERFGGLDLHLIAVTNAKNAVMPVSSLYTQYVQSRAIREEYAKRKVKDFAVSLSESVVEELQNKGVKVFFVPDDFELGGKPRTGSDSRSKSRKLHAFIPAHLRPLDIEAGADLSLLNIISTGFRVCVGIAAVSAKYGLVPSGEIVISIAGTGWAGGGADTAVIIEANPNPKKCYVIEIIGFPQMK